MNTIIKASAGSGKTYKLSNRYIGILFKKTAPETILASTFTKKAAGEILGRILTRLADAALNNKEYTELSKALQEDHLPPCPAADELQHLVAQTARNLYKLRISTLDSFFNKIASAFAFELGLPPGWKAGADDAVFTRIIYEAVYNVLDASPRNDAKTLLFLFQQGKQEQTVAKELVELAKNYLPLCRETRDTPDVWGKGLIFQSEADESELDNVEEVLADTTFQKRAKDSNNGLAKLRQSISSKDWKAVLKYTLVQNVATKKVVDKNGVITYGGNPIEGSLLTACQKLGKFAAAVEINKLLGKTQAAGKLLALIADACDEIQYRERSYRFEDIPQLVAAQSYQPQIMTHRLDAETKHLLLDEFQDTSLPQWNVIEPFADNAFNTGSTFFVGDEKQAIYGWRGGVAEIFDKVKAAFAGISEETLAKSYRSAPVIIDTVNTIFSNIQQNESLQDKKEDNDNPCFAPAAEQWSERFKLHETAQTFAGYCVLETIDADDSLPDKGNEDDEDDENGVDDSTPFTDCVVDRIAQLHNEKPAATIGVLVLRNKKIGSIIAGLKQRFNIEASEDGGVPLTNSDAVQFILSAMKLADHPGDTVARYHLTLGPLGEHLGITDYKDSYQSVCASRAIRNSIAEKGYGETVKEYQHVLLPWCDARKDIRERQRLDKLAALAYQFDSEASGVRTRWFIERVQTEKVESPTAALIKVMTVHKSKGLEFDIVVLPDLDSDLAKSTPKIITARDNSASPVNFITYYAYEEMLSFLPKEYQDAHTAHKRNGVIESLDVLYVAVTRAKRELVMLVPAKSRQGIRTYRGILQNALGENYQHGNRDWHKEKAKSEEVLPSVQPQIAPFAVAASSKLRHLTRKAPSGEELSMRQSGVAVSDVPSPDGHGRLMGTAIHQCFEYVLKKHLWLDDYVPNKEELIDNVKNSETASLDWDGIADSFIAICDKPNVRQLLSRSKETAAEELEVESERRFIVRLDEHLWRGAIDRLVIRRRNEKVIALEVIDFKSDGEERNEQYTPQLEAYRKALAKLYQLDASQISAKILYLTLDKVVEV
ncbi:MAG: UvrD-helicase domain-containing protein [Planctomycetaceae bacterium]|jgi:ATP-dependent exoDNAse (exonuclease V) beta subunit|nr:UvrD-helicase domain-containing protein [Planctomycetaceae bacterium]